MLKKPLSQELDDMRSRSQLVLEDLLFQYLESHGRRMEKYYLGFQAMVEQDVVEAMERIWLQMRDPVFHELRWLFLP